MYINDVSLWSMSLCRMVFVFIIDTSLMGKDSVVILVIEKSYIR